MGGILEGSLGHAKELDFILSAMQKALEALKPENFRMLRRSLYYSENGSEGKGWRGA